MERIYHIISVITLQTGSTERIWPYS